MSQPQGKRYSMQEVCKAIGRSNFSLRRLQKSLSLYIPRNGDDYSEGYVNFLERVVSLLAFNVPQESIVDLFGLERRVLELLRLDSITNSPTWYLDSCGDPSGSERHLLLTGYDLGFPIDADAVQGNLDFRPRDPELFGREEMGEDVGRALNAYVTQLQKVRRRVESERPVLENALAWSSRAFSRKGRRDA